MRSAFRSPGVPSTREAGTASLVGGPSNRPIRAGFAENSFLIMAVPSNTSFQTSLTREGAGSSDCLPSSPLLPRRTNCGLVALNIFQSVPSSARTGRRCQQTAVQYVSTHLLRDLEALEFSRAQLEQLQVHSRRTLTNANRRLLLAIGTNCFLLLKKPPCREDHSKHLTA